MGGYLRPPQATIAAKHETKMRTGLRILPFVGGWEDTCKARTGGEGAAIRTPLLLLPRQKRLDASSCLR